MAAAAQRVSGQKTAIFADVENATGAARSSLSGERAERHCGRIRCCGSIEARAESSRGGQGDCAMLGNLS